MTAVPTTVTGAAGISSGACTTTSPEVPAPAFALHLTVDPAAGPAATAILTDVARRVLAVIEQHPLARSRSLLAVTSTGRLSRAVARVGEELAAVDPSGTRPAAARAQAAWSAPRLSRRTRAALVLDAGAREVTRDGVVVPMTHKELGLLEHLLRNPHRAVPREELLQEVWHKDVTARTTRTIDVHVRRLREKLGGCLRIVTVRGVGYRWDPTPEVVLIGSGDAG